MNFKILIHFLLIVAVTFGRRKRQEAVGPRVEVYNSGEVRRLWYEVTVVNSGDEEATGLTVEEVLPPNTYFVPTGSSSFWSHSNGVLTATIPTLPAGESFALMVIADIDTPFGEGSESEWHENCGQELLATATVTDDTLCTTYDDNNEECAERRRHFTIETAPCCTPLAETTCDTKTVACPNPPDSECTASCPPCPQCASAICNCEVDECPACPAAVCNCLPPACPECPSHTCNPQDFTCPTPVVTFECPPAPDCPPCPDCLPQQVECPTPVCVCEMPDCPAGPTMNCTASCDVADFQSFCPTHNCSGSCTTFEPEVTFEITQPEADCKGYVAWDK